MIKERHESLTAFVDRVSGSKEGEVRLASHYTCSRTLRNKFGF